MQLLELQIASQRSKRKGGRRHRGVLLLGGLVLLLGVMFGALFVLQQMAGDLRPEGGATHIESTVIDSQ
jgi:hypothetical protein